MAVPPSEGYGISLTGELPVDLSVSSNVQQQFIPSYYTSEEVNSFANQSLSTIDNYGDGYQSTQSLNYDVDTGFNGDHKPEIKKKLRTEQNVAKALQASRPSIFAYAPQPVDASNPLSSNFNESNSEQELLQSGTNLPAMQQNNCVTNQAPKKMLVARTFPAGGGAIPPSTAAKRAGSSAPTTTSSNVLPRESTSVNHVSALIRKHLIQADNNIPTISNEPDAIDTSKKQLTAKSKPRAQKRTTTTKELQATQSLTSSEPIGFNPEMSQLSALLQKGHDSKRTTPKVPKRSSQNVSKNVSTGMTQSMAPISGNSSQDQTISHQAPNVLPYMQPQTYQYGQNEVPPVSHYNQFTPGNEYNHNSQQGQYPTDQQYYTQPNQQQHALSGSYKPFEQQHVEFQGGYAPVQQQQQQLYVTDHHTYAVPQHSPRFPQGSGQPQQQLSNVYQQPVSNMGYPPQQPEYVQYSTTTGALYTQPNAYDQQQQQQQPHTYVTQVNTYDPQQKTVVEYTTQEVRPPETMEYTYSVSNYGNQSGYAGKGQFNQSVPASGYAADGSMPVVSAPPVNQSTVFNTNQSVRQASSSAQGVASDGFVRESSQGAWKTADQPSVVFSTSSSIAGQEQISQSSGSVPVSSDQRKTPSIIRATYTTVPVSATVRAAVPVHTIKTEASVTTTAAVNPTDHTTYVGKYKLSDFPSYLTGPIRAQLATQQQASKTSSSTTGITSPTAATNAGVQRTTVKEVKLGGSKYTVVTGTSAAGETRKTIVIPPPAHGVTAHSLSDPKVDPRLEQFLKRLLPGTTGESSKQHVDPHVAKVSVPTATKRTPVQLLTVKMEPPRQEETYNHLPMVVREDIPSEEHPSGLMEISIPTKQEVEAVKALKRMKLLPVSKHHHSFSGERRLFKKSRRDKNVGDKGGLVKKIDAVGATTTASKTEEVARTQTKPEVSTLPKAEVATLPKADVTSQKQTVMQIFSSSTIKVEKDNGDDDDAVLQDGPCVIAAPELPLCRDCSHCVEMRLSAAEMITNHCCRFFKFRKLRTTITGRRIDGGFARPKDASEEEMQLWLPSPNNVPSKDDEEWKTSANILWNIGDQFCRLVEQERDVMRSYQGAPAWKGAVQGVREMCDVCQTTLFNLHWVCPTCGFVACIDCYNARKTAPPQSQGLPGESGRENSADLDDFEWILCTNKSEHDAAHLMLTQILPGKVLETLGELTHKVRRELGIRAQCDCPLNTDRPRAQPTQNAFTKQLMSSVHKTFKRELDGIHLFPRSGVVDGDSGAPTGNTETTDSVANGNNNCIQNGGGSSCGNGNNHLSLLADVALASAPMGPSILFEAKFVNKSLIEGVHSIDTKVDTSALHAIMPMVAQYCSKVRRSAASENVPPAPRRYLNAMLELHPVPRMCAQPESSFQYPDTPHSWLCNGRLLVLHEARNPHNIKLFQEQWKRGQPVLVTDVSEKLNMSMWHPDGFCRDFGNIRNDLVDCRSGEILHNVPMKMFWSGFERVDRRLRDNNGDYLLLKLKDWPPGDDFRDVLPDRFDDLMKALPLPEYTHRDGIYNLAGRLPDYFVRPDLGPKMYNAYGSALFPSKGTTNLHLDVSDAANVMVYVGVADDGHDSDAALQAVDEGGCDEATRRRVREKHVKVGALWHIFHAGDANKIRKMLQRVAQERGDAEEAHTDPIHDQSWYLDGPLRQRLFREYGVQGYAIAQCLGDVVFIPAGAPHQVRNLHSCVKVAEDFVSPENIEHCFRLTNEFRALSDTHTNHEDKLQIKNVIYHAVKDVVSTLSAWSQKSSQPKVVQNGNSTKQATPHSSTEQNGTRNKTECVSVSRPLPIMAITA